MMSKHIIFTTEQTNVRQYFKYHEEEIIKDIEDYVSGTYKVIIQENMSFVMFKQ